MLAAYFLTIYLTGTKKTNLTLHLHPQAIGDTYLEQYLALSMQTTSK